MTMFKNLLTASAFLTIAAVCFAVPTETQPPAKAALTGQKQASGVKAQFPSTGGEMLEGLRMWSKILAHKCSDGDCSHFTVRDSARGVAAFEFLNGYVEGARIAQVALD